MRSPRLRSSRLYLLLSALLALGAAGLAHSYLTHAAAAAGSTGPRQQVVVAGALIRRGAALDRDQLRTVAVPRAYAPPGSFSTVEQAAGRIALADLAPGEAVTRTRLARVRAGPVASLVPEGLRAFAVPSSLPPGAVAPGDRVDLLATFGQGQPHTETVVSGVEVLSALGGSGQGIPPSSGGIGLDVAGSQADTAATLIVLVDPDQQGRLAFARAFATLEVTIAPAQSGAA